MIEKVFTSGLTWNPINVSIATWPYERIGSRIHLED